MSKDKAASIRARLLQLAKVEKSDFDQVLVRFALERILYRLGQSPYAHRFLLKRALLFALWYETHGFDSAVNPAITDPDCFSKLSERADEALLQCACAVCLQRSV